MEACDTSSTKRHMNARHAVSLRPSMIRIVAYGWIRRPAVAGAQSRTHTGYISQKKVSMKKKNKYRSQCQEGVSPEVRIIEIVLFGTGRCSIHILDMDNPLTACIAGSRTPVWVPKMRRRPRGAALIMHVLDRASMVRMLQIATARPRWVPRKAVMRRITTSRACRCGTWPQPGIMHVSTGPATRGAMASNCATVP
jgi:hypothetical protein